MIRTARIRVFLLLAGGACGFAGLLFFVQSDFLPYGRFAPWVLASLILLGVVPGAIAVHLWRLSRKLVRIRNLTHSPEELPKAEGSTYVGEGFTWGPQQTHLLLDLGGQTSGVLPAQAEAISGDWLIHGLGSNRMENLFLPNHLLNQHLFLMGAPGSGKTRALELLIEQSIARGESVVVIDPKGDEGLLDRTYDATKRRGRADAFRVMALPYPYRSARYNPLGDFVSPSDIADRIASVLPRGGESEPFRNFAWEFVSKVATAIHMVGDTITLARLNDYIFHTPWTLVFRLMRKVWKDAPAEDAVKEDNVEPHLETYERYCAKNGVIHPELDALIAMAELDRRYFSKIAGSLRTLLSKLTNQTVGYLLSPEDISLPEGVEAVPPSPPLSWRSIDRNRLVVYFFLGSLIGQDSAAATARMCLADLASYIGKKYAFESAQGFSESRITVVVDEVADAISSESINLLNKARGAGLSLVMAGQSLADLEVSLGSRAAARRALANVGTFLTFRAANPDDASYFSDKVGLRPLPVVSTGERYEPALFSSGRSNIADFAYQSSTSVSTRNDHLLPTSSLDRLARFHYFGLWGGELRKGLLPTMTPPEHRYFPILREPLPKKVEESAPEPSPPAPDPAPAPTEEAAA